MQPGGGMVPIAVLKGCDAAAIAPDSVEGCETIMMFLGYSSKVGWCLLFRSPLFCAEWLFVAGFSFR